MKADDIPGFPGKTATHLDDVVSQVFAPPTWQFVFATQDQSDG